MTRKNIADVLAEEADHAEQHRDDDPGQGYRRARPPREPAQVYSLRVPVDRLEQLRRLAAEKHMTPSALMRSWVLERLDAEASGLVSLATGSGKTESVLALLREIVREELERAGVKRAS